MGRGGNEGRKEGVEIYSVPRTADIVTPRSLSVPTSFLPSSRLGPSAHYKDEWRGKRRRIRFLWLRGFKKREREREGGRGRVGTNERCGITRLCLSVGGGCLFIRSGMRDRNAFIHGESLLVRLPTLLPLLSFVFSSVFPDGREVLNRVGKLASKG